MTIRLAMITSEPGMKHKLAHFLSKALDKRSKHPHPAVALSSLLIIIVPKTKLYSPLQGPVLIIKVLPPDLVTQIRTSL